MIFEDTYKCNAEEKLKIRKRPNGRSNFEEEITAIRNE